MDNVAEQQTSAQAGNGRSRGTITTDAEITALARIAKIMAGLSEGDRCFVARAFAEKYQSYMQ